MPQTAYRVDDSRVVSDVLDGEVVVIDFKNGNYYGLNNTGSVLWQMLLKGHTRDQMLAHFVARFDAPPETVEKSVLGMLSDLQGLGLIAEAPAADTPEPEGWSSPKQAFFQLALQQFQDMQEMLLADPIHDVDEETGWPTLKS